MTQIGLPHHSTGKVRDLYEVDHDRMLIVASDRISVFDVVLPDEIPDKGSVLTALSTFWFEETAELWPNHLVSSDPTDFPETAGPDVAGRAMLVRAAVPIRLECIARGYLFGSAWAEYEASGTIGGAPAPKGLHRAERLPEPMFTTTTKAEAGHDETLTAGEAVDLVGADVYEQVEEATLRIYRHAATHAATCGLVLADTKLEFGSIDGTVVVIDEMCTPDSSRYWPASEVQIGGSPPSFDKQFVRDYYLEIGWDQTPPAPPMPKHVIDGTRARYLEAYEMLTGRSFDEWFGVDE
ncbi:MAG: phosphoribosylaminoimidazolesuccinocarboxamide synthase [Acidimicrobiia bacterium]